MTLEAYKFGDPEKVAIREQEEVLRQERACGKCVHRVEIEMKGSPIVLCRFKTRVYGTRCKLFKKRRD